MAQNSEAFVKNRHFLLWLFFYEQINNLLMQLFYIQKRKINFMLITCLFLPSTEKLLFLVCALSGLFFEWNTHNNAVGNYVLI